MTSLAIAFGLSGVGAVALALMIVSKIWLLRIFAFLGAVASGFVVYLCLNECAFPLGCACVTVPVGAVVGMMLWEGFRNETFVLKQ